MVRKSYNSGSYVAYAYNAEGSLARLSYGDSTGELASYRFEYDSLGRLIRSAELDADGGTVQRTEHIYDAYNRLSRQSWTLGGKTYSESYVYDDPSDTNQNGDGALTQMTTATGATIDYQYDTLRRLTRSEVSLNGSTIYTTAYAFRDLDSTRTTTQVQYRNVRSANGTLLEGKKYTYDALGNITRISQSTSPFRALVDYEYDAQNQLTKETYYDGNGTAAGNITRTISYTYDTAGNILTETRTEDGETTTKTYGYGDSDWADLLTEVDGQAITYDASGNPTSYFGRTMTWTNGRQLKTSTTHALGAVLKSTYTYDADGIRKTKTIPINRRGLTCTYTFVTQNGKVVRQSWRTESIDFFYDESGRPFAMTYQRANNDPQTYYYVLNLQGDVVKLVDVSGAEAASYEYDAWGNVLLQSGSMASTNPLRYRGYYHDSETGFYYLQSRYYDPANHRFINADVYASTGQGLAGLNMFSYCYNNPVTGYDLSGCRPSWERQYGNGLVECTDTGTGTRYTVGCAPIYTQVYGSNNPNDPNCYAYAMGSSRNEQPGVESNVYPSDYSDVYDVAASVIADFRAKGRTARKINGPYSPICADEYRIALRVGTVPYGWYYGKNGSISALYDYHFMVQTSTGQWAEKHGIAGDSILWDKSMTPNDIPWVLNDKEYYNSRIIYIAVGG